MILMDKLDISSGTAAKLSWRGLAGIALCIIVAMRYPTDLAQAQTPVDLELALAVDVSSSVTRQEYNLQMAGYAAAFRHPDVIAAIETLQPLGIAVCMIHWSGIARQEVAIKWTRITDGESARRFSARIAETDRSFLGETSLGRALSYAASQIYSNSFLGRRRTIDLSGDGGASNGPRVRHYRNEIVAQDITINALAILSDDPDLWLYFRDNIIGGSDAFVMSAADYEDFARAILQKLIREITPPLALEETEPGIGFAQFIP